MPFSSTCTLLIKMALFVFHRTQTSSATVGQLSLTNWQTRFKQSVSEPQQPSSKARSKTIWIFIYAKRHCVNKLFFDDGTVSTDLHKLHESFWRLRRTLTSDPWWTGCHEQTAECSSTSPIIWHSGDCRYCLQYWKCLPAPYNVTKLCHNAFQSIEKQSTLRSLC